MFQEIGVHRIFFTKLINSTFTEIFLHVKRQICMNIISFERYSSEAIYFDLMRHVNCGTTFLTKCQ